MKRKELIEKALSPQEVITCSWITNDGREVTYTGMVSGFSYPVGYIRLSTEDGIKSVNPKTLLRVNDYELKIPKNRISPHKASGGFEVYFEGNYAGLAHSKKEAKQLIRTCERIKKIYE